MKLMFKCSWKPLDMYQLLSFYCLSAVCEHAYSLAQNLDPNSEGRGVLQFKTGLMSVIKVCVV
jgi:hypothetical protein